MVAYLRCCLVDYFCRYELLLGNGRIVWCQVSGGVIYEMSLNPEPSFILIVWLTGFAKLLGAVLLLLLLVPWRNAAVSKVLYYISKIAGVFLFVYGFLNFITISMSAFAILDMDLEAHAIFWRLVFWEPFWMAGGICYFFSVKKQRSI